MLKDEVYYQFTYPEPEISETTDAATLSGMFDDI